MAIVEERLVGGECSFFGCIPSKTLLRPGDVVAAARRVPGAAEAVTGEIDLAAALAQRDYMTSDWNDEGQVPWLDSKGIELVRGHGRLAGERVVEVTTDDGVRRLTAIEGRRARDGHHAGDAADRRVSPTSAPGTTGEATSATAVPRRFLVLGGGPIGVEMAQAFRRLGSRARSR